tara:strand:- start:360 stop:617 length:258 start_codon:yes stop_codon:yes gene_type:complete
VEQAYTADLKSALCKRDKGSNPFWSTKNNYLTKAKNPTRHTKRKTVYCWVGEKTPYILMLYGDGSFSFFAFFEVVLTIYINIKCF